MSTESREDIEFEEAWATYIRLQSDRVLWQKIKARERYENDLRLRLAGARRKGYAEGQNEKRFEVARNLKHLGVPLATIAEVTGLSLSEIERLD